jgi:hypothetical protein
VVVDSRPCRARPGQRRQFRLITALALLAAALGMTPWSAAATSDPVAGYTTVVRAPQTVAPVAAEIQDQDHAVVATVDDQTISAATGDQSLISGTDEIAVSDPYRSAVGSRAPPQLIV